MAQDVYVNCAQKVTEQVEMVEDVYENPDVVKGHETPGKRGKRSERSNQQAQQKGEDTWSRCSRPRLTAVCVLVLCVLLLIIITVLWIKFSNPNTQNSQLDTSAGWKKFNSSLYYISNEKKNWTESRQDCIDRGADLVIITSIEEQMFISANLSKDDAWIGLKYNGEEHMWKWVDNSTFTTGYWYQEDIFAIGECTITSPRADVKTWAIYPCNPNVFSICEKIITST